VMELCCSVLCCALSWRANRADLSPRKFTSQWVPATPVNTLRNPRLLK
jgi:hypothetical protein